MQEFVVIIVECIHIVCCYNVFYQFIENADTKDLFVPPNCMHFSMCHQVAHPYSCLNEIFATYDHYNGFLIEAAIFALAIEHGT